MNHLKIIAFFFSLSLLLVYSATAQNCTFDDPQKQKEYNFLVELYHSETGYFRQAVGPSWQQLTDGDICSLCGIQDSRVRCNFQGYITSLNFRETEIGDLPASIEDLTYLNTITLSYNITFREFPESIGNLPNLEWIDAQYCNIYTLPESIGQLNKLEFLRVSNNEIRKLPDSLGYLPKLEELWADENKLTTIPATFGSLASLRRLILSRNQIHALPRRLSYLTDLNSLSLYENYISCLPVEMAAMCGQTGASLWDNPIDVSYFSEICDDLENYACPYQKTIMPCYEEHFNNSAISYGNGTITINALFYYLIQILQPSGVEPAGRLEVVNITDGSYETIVLCDGDCERIETINGLPSGEYLVRIFDEDGLLFCELSPDNAIFLEEEETNPTGEADCEAVIFETSNNQITIRGLRAAYNKVELFGANTNWQNLTICDGDCASIQVIEPVANGTYTVKVQQLGENGAYCYRSEELEVLGDNTGIVMDSTRADCSQLLFRADSGQIMVSGLQAAHDKIELFGANTNWQNLTVCDGNCDNPQVINNLAPGEYEVKVQQKDENGGYCYRAETLAYDALTTENQRQHYSQNIHLVGFEKQGQVQLRWVTASPKATTHFIVEGQTETANFEPLALVPVALNEKSNQFQWEGAFSSSATQHYRIRQCFANGSFQYSASVPVDFPTSHQTTKLFPNPASKEIYLDLSDEQGKMTSIQLFNTYGYWVKTYPAFEVHQNIERLDLSNVENGLYWLKVKAAGERSKIYRFVVEHWK